LIRRLPEIILEGELANLGYTRPYAR